MANDVFRKAYRQLNSDEALTLEGIKNTATVLYDCFDRIPPSREASLAKTKLEEAVMWAVKGLTA